MHIDETQRLVTRTPLPRHARGLPDQIARWVESVAPCIVHTASQSPDVTVTVVSHLKRESVIEEHIATALGQTHYDWTFPVTRTFIRISTLMRMNELERTRTAPLSMMPHGRADLTAIQLKAAEIDAEYGANAENPELQRTLLRALLDLLNQVGDTLGKMEPEKQKIEDVQAEVLRSAPNIARIIRHVSPEELRRMRLLPTADSPGAPYRGPNLGRMPVRGR